MPPKRRAPRPAGPPRESRILCSGAHNAQVFENRLDKSCPLGPNRHDLLNGIMIFVGCGHGIAWPVAHSARPDEGHCAAFHYFRTPFLASPLSISPLMDVRWTLAEAAPSRCRQNGGPRGRLDRPGDREYGVPEPTMRSF